MNFDFLQAMTSYELLAIVLALLALLMPLIKWLIVKIFFPLKLTYIPQNNHISLIFDEYGPYAGFSFSLHCENKPILIKNITIIVKNISNKAELSLIWSNIQSPACQQMQFGGTTYTNNTACPTQLDANSLPFFIVTFVNTNNEVKNKLKTIHEEKMDGFTEIKTDGTTYEEELENFKGRKCYKKNYDVILEEMFWRKGDYEFDIVTTYDNDKKFMNKYAFKISQQEYERFKEGIELSLICRLNQKYMRGYNFYVVQAPFTKVK